MSNNWYVVYAEPHRHLNGAISFGAHVVTDTAEGAADLAASLCAGEVSTVVHAVVPCPGLFGGASGCSHPVAVSGYGAWRPPRTVNQYREDPIAHPVR